MGRINYLYRRASGIYVVRICVPARLKSVFKVGEMHISTASRDLLTAKAAQLQILAAWQARLMEEKRMQIPIDDDTPFEVAKVFPIFKGDGEKAFGFKVPLTDGESQEDWRLWDNGFAGRPITTTRREQAELHKAAQFRTLMDMASGTFDSSVHATNLSQPATPRTPAGLSESALNIVVVPTGSPAPTILRGIAERHRIRDAGRIATVNAAALGSGIADAIHHQTHPSRSVSEVKNQLSSKAMLLSDLKFIAS